MLKNDFYNVERYATIKTDITRTIALLTIPYLDHKLIFLYTTNSIISKRLLKSVVPSGTEDDDDEHEDVLSCRTAGVFEMKNSKKKDVNQLISNMVHFGVQLTLKRAKL